jgi:hypothetical protein
VSVGQSTWSGCRAVRATWMTPPARSVRIAVSALTEWTIHGRCWRPRMTVLPGRGRWPSTPVVWMTVRAVLSAATATRVAASSASAVSGTANVTSTVTNRPPGATVAVSSAQARTTRPRRRWSRPPAAPNWRTRQSKRVVPDSLGCGTRPHPKRTSRWAGGVVGAELVPETSVSPIGFGVSCGTVRPRGRAVGVREGLHP